MIWVELYSVMVVDYIHNALVKLAFVKLHSFSTWWIALTYSPAHEYSVIRFRGLNVGGEDTCATAKLPCPPFETAEDNIFWNRTKTLLGNQRRAKNKVTKAELDSSLQYCAAVLTTNNNIQIQNIKTHLRLDTVLVLEECHHQIIYLILHCE